MSASSSGTYTWGLSNGGLIREALEQATGQPPTEIDRRVMASAYISLQLELAEWSNRGINLWKISSGNVIDLVVGTAVYTLPTNLVDLTELYFTQVNGNGAGYNLDRIMIPINRDQYAMLPNKLQPGTPTQYWFERLSPAPQITIWQPPSAGAPSYVVTWNGLIRVQDANPTLAETPDVPYRALPALTAGLAKRLAFKFAPARHALCKAEADELWASFVSNDQERGPTVVTPDLSSYANMSR